MRNVLVEALLHFGEFLFEFSDALLLAVDPFGAKLLALFLQFLTLLGHLIAQAIEFIAAAMQVGDEFGRFVSFRSEQRASVFDDGIREAKAASDGDSAGPARHAN